jgi:hypothetical protein
MRPAVIVVCSLFPIVSSLPFSGSALFAKVDMKEVKFFIRCIFGTGRAKLSLQTIT